MSNNRRYPVKRPTVVDFFCGAGGLSLGFEQAGFDIVLGVDQDGHHAATHERNFPYGKSLCGSVVELTGDKVRKLAGFKEIDVVVGGPPCQGFSHMGLRDLADPRNSLVRHYMRLVLEIKPKVFLMENVPGLLSGETKKILEDVIELAEAGGYRITKPVRVLDASDFGVPQKRKRLFLLGTRNDIAEMAEYPKGPCKGQPERPTVMEAIGDLPVIEENEKLLYESFTSYTKKPKSPYAQVARGAVEDPSDLSRPRGWDEKRCSGCLRVTHTPRSIELYRATPPGQVVPGHKLPRLDPNGIAPTLRAGSDSTHGSYTAPRPIHPVFPRCITAREAARLHGFPDWFTFYPLKWHAYRQVGNAVCPPIARALGSQILKVLGVRMTERQPETVVLGDEFILPDDRPRMLKRIPVMQEYPPVIRWLFEQAYDESKKRLKKETFSFDDVNRAIEDTKVNLSWIREDTFLPEIARSRAVNRILSPVHAAGFSIIECREKGAIGRFVPIGTPGTIEDKETIQVRIDEIHNAVSLHLPPMRLNGDPRAIASILQQSAVCDDVWGRKKTVRLASDRPEDIDFENGKTSVYRIAVKTGRGKDQPSALLTTRNATPFTKSRIARIAINNECDEVVVLVSATTKHFVAIRYDHCRDAPKEVSRTAFLLADDATP